MASASPEEEVEARAVRELAFFGHSLRFMTDWGCGIGGEFWTTGIDLVKIMEEQRDFFDALFRGRRVIELGSGTGLVGLCAAFFGAAETVLTDTESHIPILEKNLEANAHLLSSSSSSAGCCGAASPEPPRVVVQEFDWSRSASHLGPAPFDVILGTDLAYAPELYDPLIQAYCQLAGPETVIILGVTRSDTGPPFFSKLHAAGFDYCLMGGSQALEKGGGNFVLLSIVDRRARRR